MNCQSNVFKNNIRDLAKETHQLALDELDKFNVTTFHQMVFNSSYSEGVLETDTILRLVFHKYKQNFREKLLDHQELVNSTKIIRKIASVGNPVINKNFDDSIWHYQRSEMFEEKEYLNKYHIAINLGDIFKINDSEFILLEQPCDLAVRPDGKREAKNGFLIGIVGPNQQDKDLLTKLENKFVMFQDGNLPKDKFVNLIIKMLEKNKDSTKFFPLKNYKKTEIVKVFFESRMLVNLDILDLCAFSNNGVSKIESDSIEPDYLTIGYSNKFTELKKTIIERNKSNSNFYKNEIIESTEIQNGYSFNIERVGRLNQPYSSELLIKFAQHVSRLPFEHDLSRYNKKYLLNNSDTEEN
jgi:hypothetical protein